MHEQASWIEELQIAITVTDRAGTIVEMNGRSRSTFASDGGGELIGRNLVDCHPPAARDKIAALIASGGANHYTIRKGGRRKIIHQMPWFQNGQFAGLVEISVPIPEQLPEFDRDAPRGV